MVICMPSIASVKKITSTVMIEASGIFFFVSTSWGCHASWGHDGWKKMQGKNISFPASPDSSGLV
jgi:hypothetical protein